MIKLFSTKTITGNPYDAMDTTFISIFSYFNKEEAVYYSEAPEDFQEIGAIKKIKLRFKNQFLRILEKAFLMRRLKPDYLFGYGGFAELPFVFLKPKSIKYIINFHSILVRRGDSDWPVRTPWFLRSYLFKKADIIVVISKAARKTILDYFPQKRVELVYSGVNLDEFISRNFDREYLKKKFDIKFNQPLVIYIGTLQSRKRPDVFIEIARRYQKANFLMVGRGDQKFLEAAKDLLNLKYIEKMERDDIAKLFASADVLLFPSINEPYGLVIVEAMASGMPVIVSASGAFPELVKDGEDGFLIPVAENEIDHFIFALDKIIDNKNLWEKLSQHAVRNVKRFSWENTAKGYKDILLIKNFR